MLGGFDLINYMEGTTDLSSLNDMLHVPLATHNLLSINKLCNDNNLSLVFDSQKVEARDKATGEVVLKGRVKGETL